ncbi:MAG TPA: DUF3500 domain-containing protein [Candidatus Limnocylindria bacterium]|jgi:hypothetical protein|nr:DUF3500 domain-containing protein [Candidatus Limnocylindria bacterium]
MKLSLLLTALLCLRALAGTPEEMAASAKNLVDALDDMQRAKALFAFDAEERENWHFIPKERKGLTLKEMTAAQQRLAFALLNSGLSQRGYGQAMTIMSLEQILQDMEGPTRKFPRDPELYHVSIFGTPSDKGSWGWRVEGHHLSVNFTLIDGKVVAGTPSFMGTNPGEVKTGRRAGLRVLGAEEELGRQLVKSLSESQRKTAVLDTKAPDDILTLASRKADLGKPVGLPLSELNPEQHELAVKLIHAYIDRLRWDLSTADFAKIEAAGLDNVRFAWMGSFERGQRHYYRMHGPTFVLEYDNTQNDANHVHAVWRDFNGDFGRDMLADHLKADHGK